MTRSVPWKEVFLFFNYISLEKEAHHVMKGPRGSIRFGSGAEAGARGKFRPETLSEFALGRAE